MRQTSPSNSSVNNSKASAVLPGFHRDLLSSLGWDHEASITLPERTAGFAEQASLPPLSEASGRLLAEGPLYKHQALALSMIAEGHPVVLSTGTGSGKTRVFHFSATETLSRHPRGLVLALYPGKALAREQAARWHEALVQAGLAEESDGSVVLLTGDSCSRRERSLLLSSAKVAVLTPDVLHAWMLASLGDRRVRGNLQRLRMVVIDEAHTYSGVFGSNSLWLFRRLQHALTILNAPEPSWIAASATLAQPAEHLLALTGRSFKAVEECDDSSPRHARHLHFIRPAQGTAPLSGLGAWIKACAERSDLGRFAVFSQSRKQTETLSLIGNRGATQASATPSEEAEANLLLNASNRIAPFRAGLSPAERQDLQERFSRGELRGLVCTSAFELGIDLPGLDLGFLHGLPESPASFWQRLGRFGRHGESHVFIIHDSSARADLLFAAPFSIFDWRARDAALYPDNPVLLARHILCLASEAEALGRCSVPLPPELPFSESFRSGYAAFLRGELTPALREAQALQGGALPPHLVFPLRSVDETFTFKGAGGGPAPEGTLTRGQLMREAYPGAVYYHAGTPWRITGVNSRRRELTVARSPFYHTEPIAVPALFVPDLLAPVFHDLRWTELTMLEARGRATECVTGFTENRGGHASPGGDYAQGACGQSGPFFRSYDTTGVMLFHPSLANSQVRIDTLGALLREALLLTCPREASEIANASGQLRVSRRELTEGTRFVALYDTVSGSLRLTSALAEPEILNRTLLHALRLARTQLDAAGDLRDAATLHALESMSASAAGTSLRRLPDEWPEAAPDLVIAPGSHALHKRRSLEVIVLGVSTNLDGELIYEIHRIDDPAFHGTVGAEALAEIPGATSWVPLSSLLEVV